VRILSLMYTKYTSYLQWICRIANMAWFNSFLKIFVCCNMRCMISPLYLYLILLVNLKIPGFVTGVLFSVYLCLFSFTFCRWCTIINEWLNQLMATSQCCYCHKELKISRHWATSSLAVAVIIACIDNITFYTQTDGQYELAWPAN